MHKAHNLFVSEQYHLYIQEKTSHLLRNQPEAVEVIYTGDAIKTLNRFLSEEDYKL